MITSIDTTIPIWRLANHTNSARNYWMAGAALKRFELENNIQTVEADQIYKYDAAKHQAVLQAKPWAKEYDLVRSWRLLTFV